MNDIHETYNRIEELYLKITKDYMGFDESGIDEALLKHTAVYAFFGAVLAHAKRVVNREENDYEYEEAKVREERREELKSSGQRATDRALDAFVKTVPSLRDAQSKVQDASHRYNLAKNIVSSLEHQKDMLVQISANKRAEVKLHEL